jgi:hypothetical protein
MAAKARLGVRDQGNLYGSGASRTYQSIMSTSTTTMTRATTSRAVLGRASPDSFVLLSIDANPQFTNSNQMTISPMTGTPRLQALAYLTACGLTDLSKPSTRCHRRTALCYWRACQFGRTFHSNVTSVRLLGRTLNCDGAGGSSRPALASHSGNPR